ncbi:alpha/beta hydrolase [Micromonospora sp. DR5-3]|uniref:alpha/beta fold hydrolase n=1 Tax=unclassified Micromonospora TaxID=2617518 RepID=UPI0011D2FC93|nr:MULTISPECIES: alpha/beta hydrolase [unclassified Micromonospora]MCW3818493.1 alpha/beta hydrolase [Micromonospora sp. DR5-3]TYC19205.1 alpha/beta hydrolase [Micromonospora sp. MP36]
MAVNVTRVAHRHVDVDGLRIFYRESVPSEQESLTRPPLLLLHGFPSASHQYRRLIDVLGDRHRLIAPDYPGFGHSDVPTPASAGGDFSYCFDRLADVMERFVDVLGLSRFVLYMFDFGAPVGFRLATRNSDRVAGLIVQNGNAYDEGLSDMARNFIALDRDDPGAEEQVRALLTLPATRAQYEGGTSNPDEVAPDGWTLDQHFLDQPGRSQPQIDLAFDYKSNLRQYGRWQEWLRTHRPPTLIVWGRKDPFFPASGAHAYLRDVPDGELHLFDTGHFALEEKLPEIAPLMADFLDRLSRSGW